MWVRSQDLLHYSNRQISSITKTDRHLNKMQKLIIYESVKTDKDDYIIHLSMKLDSTIDIHYSITKWLSGAVKLWSWPILKVEPRQMRPAPSTLPVHSWGIIEEWHTHLEHWRLEVWRRTWNRNHGTTCICKKAQQ